MRLYERDFRSVFPEEKQEYERILNEERRSVPYGKINLYDRYPEAIKHNLSLFPNNHIDLYEMKKSKDIHSINMRFKELIHKGKITERDILKFINHDPQAYHIIASIFERFNFGHHEAYLFPEFCLGEKYRADYLLIGKGSGGYEFIFVELEKPNGRVVLDKKYLGQNIRSGENQVNDWKTWNDSNFIKLSKFFESEKSEESKLPLEFYEFDSTRMHYVVVGGTRDNYTKELYGIRRRKLKESAIHLLHYDNLYDSSELLVEKNTF